MFCLEPHRLAVHFPNVQQGTMMSHESCPSGQSGNRREFTGDNQHPFPGMKGLEIFTVWVFSTLSVCMDCEIALFTIAKPRGKDLADRDHRDLVDGIWLAIRALVIAS